MTAVRSRLLFVVLIAGALADAVLLGILWQQRQDVREQRQIVIQLETALRQGRHRAEKIATEQAALDAALAQAQNRAAAAQAATTSPASILSRRIHLLKQMLEASPSQRIPELALLDNKDWIHLAQRAKLDSEEEMLAELSRLRRVARGKFIQQLQAALRAFLDSSGNELPTDLRQLATHLSPPADAAMLDRYTLAQTGRMGDDDGKLILEKSSPDAERDGLISAGLWAWKANPNPAADDNPLDKWMNEVGVEFPGEDVKQAMERFTEAHPDKKPVNFFDLLPHLRQPEQLIASVRPMLAWLQFTMDQFSNLEITEPGGTTPKFDSWTQPPQPGQMNRYLEMPFETESLLRAVKIGPDGRSAELKF